MDGPPPEIQHFVLAFIVALFSAALAWQRWRAPTFAKVLIVLGLFVLFVPGACMALDYVQRPHGDQFILALMRWCLTSFAAVAAAVVAIVEGRKWWERKKQL